jgi:NTP pyrophosphatase (non-canonical NTP hydrolase)
MLTEKEVVQEIKRAKLRHGPFPRDMIRSYVLLSEEVGEVARAVAETTRLPRLNARRPTHLNDLREELVQCVAVISMWVANLDVERERDEREGRV